MIVGGGSGGSSRGVRGGGEKIGAGGGRRRSGGGGGGVGGGVFGGAGAEGVADGAGRGAGGRLQRGARVRMRPDGLQPDSNRATAAGGCVLRDGGAGRRVGGGWDRDRRQAGRMGNGAPSRGRIDGRKDARSTGGRDCDWTARSMPAASDDSAGRSGASERAARRRRRGARLSASALVGANQDRAAGRRRGGGRGRGGGHKPTGPPRLLDTSYRKNGRRTRPHRVTRKRVPARTASAYPAGYPWPLVLKPFFLWASNWNAFRHSDSAQFSSLWPNSLLLVALLPSQRESPSV